MATYHNLLTLSNATATELTPGARHSGLDLTVQNVDEAAYVYVGGEGVTSSDYGYRIAPGGAISFEVNPNDRIYAISNTDGSNAALMRILLEEL